MIQDVFRAEGLPLDSCIRRSSRAPSSRMRCRASRLASGNSWRDRGRERPAADCISTSGPTRKSRAAAAKHLPPSTRFSRATGTSRSPRITGPRPPPEGDGRVGVDDFWQLADKPKALPRETREYVPMILVAIVIARTPRMVSASSRARRRDTTRSHPPSGGPAPRRGVGRNDD